MLGRRRRPSVFDDRPYRRPRINLIRPPGYKTNQAWQDWRAMKYVARTPIILGKELKFADYTYASSPVSQNAWTLEMPAAGALNAVAQGDSESQRIGRKITNSSLHIRGTVAGTSTLVVSRKVRVVVVKDSQTNGAALTAGNVMTGLVNGFRNLEYTSRFRVVYDKTFVLRPDINDTPAGNGPKANFTVNVNVPGETLFNGNLADIADITDCSYQLIAIADGPDTTIEYESRFRYRG